jgi:hypothetical protein
MEAMLLTVTGQEKVIHILEQSALCHFSWEAREVGSQVFSKQGWSVFEPLGKEGSGQLHLTSRFWAGPLEGKKRLALQGQMEAEECVF